jgi:hypothetical protein
MKKFDYIYNILINNQSQFNWYETTAVEEN